MSRSRVQKHRTLPNVLLLNIRSIAGKKDELAALVEVYDSNLVFVTETWLCGKIPDEIIHLPDMTSIKTDRTSGRGAGGVI